MYLSEINCVLNYCFCIVCEAYILHFTVPKIISADEDVLGPDIPVGAKIL